MINSPIDEKWKKRVAWIDIVKGSNTVAHEGISTPITANLYILIKCRYIRWSNYLDTFVISIAKYTYTRANCNFYTHFQIPLKLYQRNRDNRLSLQR